MSETRPLRLAFACRFAAFLLSLMAVYFGFIVRFA